MSSLPIDQAIRIIRAFGHFSHLANIAEDQHHIRRTRAHAIVRTPARQGTMVYALRAPPGPGFPANGCRPSSPMRCAAPC